MIIQEIEIQLGEKYDYYIDLSKNVSNETDRLILINGFVLYFVKNIYNLGKGMDTAQLLDFYFGKVNLDIIKAGDAKQKSKLLKESDYRLLKSEVKQPMYVFKCIVKQNKDLMVANTPWSKEIQESEEQSAIVERSISSFLHYLNEKLSVKEMLTLGMMLGGVSSYYQNVRDYYDIECIYEALPYAVKFTNDLIDEL